MRKSHAGDGEMPARSAPVRAEYGVIGEEESGYAPPAAVSERPVSAEAPAAKGEERQGRSDSAEGQGPKHERPDFRIVQPSTSRDGKSEFIDVGAMWKATSKAGNEFYTLKIGKLKLLVFPNRK